MYTESDPLLPTYEQATGKGQRRRSRQCSPVWPLVLFPSIGLFVTLILLSVFSNDLSTIFKPKPKPKPIPYHVAVIGAGPAGAFSARQLRRLAGKLDKPLSITVFERKSAVGGRLVPDLPLYPFDDALQQPLLPESASALSLSNGAILEAAREHGIPFRPHDHSEKIFYNIKGSSELTRPSSKASLSSWLWELWCFGFSSKNAKAVGNTAKNQFLQIYRETAPINSTQELVRRHGLGYVLANGGLQALEGHGVSRDYVEDVLRGEIAIQYGQNMEALNNLALGIGAYNADEGRSLQGGSMTSTLEAILDSSDVDLRLSTEVYGFRKLNATKWLVVSRQPGTSGEGTIDMFDGVIFAAPFFPDEFEYRDTTFQTPPQIIDYKTRHVTWFASPVQPDRDALGVNVAKPFPDRAIMKIPDSWPHSSTGQGLIEVLDMGAIAQRNSEGPGSQHAYRVLSEVRLEDEHLPAILGGMSPSWVGRHEIKTAYPNLSPRSAFPPMVLDDRFWSPLSIEAIGSSVELSAWAGKNVASLVVTELAKRSDD